MRLPKKTKVIWNRADKQFDIGIQAGFQPDSLEWILKPAMVKEAAKMGAQVRITVYGVDLLRRSELRRD